MQISFNKEVIRIHKQISINQTAIQNIQTEVEQTIRNLKTDAKRYTKELISENKRLERRLKTLL